VIKRISIIEYRKLKKLDFDFSPGINAISGTNGTCKTSLLHIISNSFQSVTKSKKCTWVTDFNCLKIIRNTNSSINPKIESLTKGDKKYNDPAKGRSGTIFEVEYINDFKLQFRKHNSDKNNRFAVKPPYKAGNTNSLPYCPVVYLGLTRLFPFGEFQNDEEIEKITKGLPDTYQQELAELYASFTNIGVISSVPQKMGDIRVRSDFSSQTSGIDSNTISSGEDNLFMILTSLISLKFYYDSINSNNQIESIMLIDELDATLHPSYQFKLLDIFRKFSHDCKIQFIFTTHSLSLLEFSLKKKDNVIYLIDNITNIHKLDQPDIYKIKMYLHNITRYDIYIKNCIPIFTEDNEARIFLNIIFDYYAANINQFYNAKKLFHFVDANIGAENLVNIFNDIYLLKSTMQSICILDGDKKEKRDFNKYTIVLPGEKSPDELIMDYSIQIYNDDDPFWTNDIIISLNYGKIYYLQNIKPDLDSIAQVINDLHDRGESTHGVAREKRKKIFIKHHRFFEILFEHWVNNIINKEHLNKFYDDLYIMFRKVAELRGINPDEWQRQL
jgi:AAA15 family ATPase/GTPase